jgi:hypothetical protein
MKIWSPLPESLHCSSPLLVVFLVASAIYMFTASDDVIIHRIGIGCLMWAFWISMLFFNKELRKNGSRIKTMLNL